MKSAIEWFTKNPVAANLLMVLILAGGLFTGLTLKKEIFPEFSLDMITVQVSYRGAAPEEVEEGVCIRIEEAIEGLDGIKRITSSASEGNGSVTIEVESGADARKLLEDVKARIDAIETFPEEIEKPIVQELTNRQQVINVAVHGAIDESNLKILAERVRDELAAVPGLTQVEVANARSYEISIEVSETLLRRHNLTFDEVANAVRRSSLDMPGGSVKTDGGEFLLRTKGQAYRGYEFDNLVLFTRSDGTHLRLGDVATVVDGFEETEQFSRFQNEPALIIAVYRTGDQSAPEVSAAVYKYVEQAQSRFPAGVTLTPMGDSALVLSDRLNLLVRNGLTGFVLVFIVLTLFLRFGLAFWVSLGIPISFLGALWLLPALDVSINMMSLFAFIVVLGILVDDAIIVGENIYTHQERSGNRLQGAITGAHEVATPVTFAVLTSVAAFAPLMFITGVMGKMMIVMPLVVMPCLVFSLIESLLILPAHLARHRNDRARLGFGKGIRRRIDGGLQNFIKKRLSPVAGTRDRVALRHRSTWFGYANAVARVSRRWLGPSRVHATNGCGLSDRVHRHATGNTGRINRSCHSTHGRSRRVCATRSRGRNWSATYQIRVLHGWKSSTILEWWVRTAATGTGRIASRRTFCRIGVIRGAWHREYRCCEPLARTSGPHS